MPVVILDACVLFPMYLRDTLLSVAEANLYELHWSQKILDEAMRNLVQKGKMSTQKAINLEQVMKIAFPQAMVDAPIELERLMTNDLKDRHVVAAAVEAKANIIVTSNLADFNAEALIPWNIKANSPDNFLCNLFDEYPEEMVEVLTQQCNKYIKRSITLTELLNLLSKKDGANLIEFANKIRFYLSQASE